MLTMERAGERRELTLIKWRGVAELLASEARREHRRRMFRTIFAFALALFLVGGAAWGWSAWHRGQARTYTTDVVKRADIKIVLTATGELEPQQTVLVNSLITGTIASVSVSYDEAVKRGQVLARLSTPDLEARIRRASAMVAAQTASRDAAQASLTNSEAALRRGQELAKGALISPREIELAETTLQIAQANYAVAQAQVHALEADLVSAEDDLAKATIVSPIDGVVLDVNARAGETVTMAGATAPLFTIASDLHLLELHLDIDEADIAKVKVGDSVSFTLEARFDSAFTGVIRQVRMGPTISNGVISYKAIVAVENPDTVLRPGMTATADITTDRASNVLTVPNSALRFQPQEQSGGLFGSVTPRSSIEVATMGPQHVYVLSDNALHQVAIVAGRTDGLRTEVVSGELKQGDLVVTGSGGV